MLGLIGSVALAPDLVACDAQIIGRLPIEPELAGWSGTLPETKPGVARLKHNQALRMKARLPSLGFSLLLQPQNMGA